MKKFLKAIFLIVGVIFLTLVAIGIFKKEIVSENRVTINAPSSKVFAVYNNPFLMHRWITDFKSLENISGTLNQVGSQWKLTFASSETDNSIIYETITSFEQNQRIAVDYQNDWVIGKSDALFEASDQQSTVIHYTQRYKGTGIVQNAMLFLMSGKIEEMNQQNLEQLKILIEQSGADELE